MKKSIVSICCLLFLSGTAQWSLLSDFEGLTPEELGSQGGWTTAPAAIYRVAADPIDASNQSFLVNEAGGGACIALGGGIADGATSTVFFRANVDSPADFVFGTSDVAALAAWGDYEGYMRCAFAT